MPGHAAAANRAYPEYSGGGTEKHPDFTFNPGKEATYDYLTDILRETIDLFPSPWIHFGGDEVSFAIKSWKENAQVKALTQLRMALSVPLPHFDHQVPIADRQAGDIRC
ncbi:MAG: family 20 glycosylhydrolase [Planctomycetes bacterium]|nr:family 20 glycosylhydrolase [Planctomycetota bacterium]